ncbi:MAG: imidazole glycerol phosphate synthase subunit HisH [Clostridiaceae bacterium]|nr:imidazole glycerol phosphate synthase subunit HisH [Clostridiaceae bacterium]
MVAIIDYGVGNLYSLKSSFAAIGEEAVVTNDEEVIRGADRVILPGVGAFCDAMEKLKSSGMADLLVCLAKEGKKIMGICLGMQLLFDRSFEYGEYEGLGLIKGEIRPISDVIDKELKIPHIGWNALHFVKNGCPIFKYISEGDYVYFVHSFYAANCDEATVATADYSAPLTAAVQSGNVFGCQFHPEKSGDKGLTILKAFCEI